MIRQPFDYTVLHNYTMYVPKTRVHLCWVSVLDLIKFNDKIERKKRKQNTFKRSNMFYGCKRTLAVGKVKKEKDI